MIHSRSRGTLNAGQFSEKEPPKGIEIKIAATSSEKVKWETKMLGSKERYTLIYEISNRSDSPAFAYLARKVD